MSEATQRLVDYNATDLYDRPNGSVRSIRTAA